MQFLQLRDAILFLHMHNTSIDAKVIGKTAQHLERRKKATNIVQYVAKVVKSC